MTQIEDRWYIVSGSSLHVFNAPDPRMASGSSHTSVADLPYYRNQFRLRKAVVTSDDQLQEHDLALI